MAISRLVEPGSTLFSPTELRVVSSKEQVDVSDGICRLARDGIQTGWGSDAGHHTRGRIRTGSPAVCCIGCKAPGYGPAAVAVILQGTPEKPFPLLPLEERLHPLPLCAGPLRDIFAFCCIPVLVQHLHVAIKLLLHVQVDDAAQRSPLAALHTHRKVLGIIGVCHGPSVSDFNEVFKEFEDSCRCAFCSYFST